MAKSQIATIRVRRLASELVRFRERKRLSIKAVADATGVNEVTLRRIEARQARPQKRTLIALLDAYAVRGDEREKIVALARGAQEQGWIRPYDAELPDEYNAFIQFESEASELKKYESLFVPGLLQTEDYARAVIGGTLRTAPSSEVELRVRARMERQSILTREEPVSLRVAMDEAALRRLVGGADVMRAQLDHLAKMSMEPHIQVQVIPFTAGVHPGMPGSFVLMNFARSAEPEIVWVDSHVGDMFLEKPMQIARLTTAFDELIAQASSPAESLAMITTLRDRLGISGGTG
ncbi:helix-turn-helix domain-containing protein [Streptomyces sp. NPDC049879]|uniref:helix-turn-helix domain-containing protein n=1 Tax=Streptomyces sp. NPDC049879 TaxID=3365598 RepID=UPI003787FFEC